MTKHAVMHICICNKGTHAHIQDETAVEGQKKNSSIKMAKILLILYFPIMSSKHFLFQIFTTTQLKLKFLRYRTF